MFHRGGFPGMGGPFGMGAPMGAPFGRPQQVFAGRRAPVAQQFRQPGAPPVNHTGAAGTVPPSRGSHVTQQAQSQLSYARSGPGQSQPPRATRTLSAGYAGQMGGGRPMHSQHGGSPVRQGQSLRTASAGYQGYQSGPHFQPQPIGGATPLRRSSQPYGVPMFQPGPPVRSPVRQSMSPTKQASPAQPVAVTTASPVAAQPAASPAKPTITLYTAGTPNGWKISIALEELGLAFEPRAISFKEREQKSDWFLKINPNGRIPAIVDHANGDFAVFESGAILHYLAQKTGKLLGNNAKDNSEAMQWVMFGIGGIGPMQGQANHFVRYASEDIPYAVKRYTDETLRLYQVLDDRLKDRDYLVGAGRGTFTIADIANFTWVACHKYCKVGLEDTPNLARWLEALSKRPSVLRGVDCPKGCMNPITGMTEADSKKFADKAKDALFKDKDGKGDDK